MKLFLRNLLAVLAGFAAGSAVNMAIILVSPQIIPPPAGVDVSSAASMKASLHLYQPQHFLFPFLAHAGGTLAGALVAFLLAGSRREVFAHVLGVLFLAGGITACFLIPAPAWFIAVDLLGAYVPMACLAIRIGRRLTESAPAAGAG